MCIRDSGREAEGLDFAPYPGALGQRVFDNVSKEAWQQWIRPVSYTHLDVYKRQLLIGAEGGLDPREVEAARSTGFVAVSLGPRVLRTETAGLAALSTLQALWGDFKT